MLQILLNQAYNPLNIYINSLGVDIIEDDLYYNLQEYDYNSLVNFDTTSNAIDIYIVHNYLYAGKANGIPSKAFVVRGDYVLGSTTPHEMGHCLNLFHTHETGFGIENIPRTGTNANCSSAGDLLCDTPADPGLFGKVNQNCVYTEVDGYSPDTHNMMSYSRKSCRDSFTNGQELRIRDALAGNSILQQITTHCCEGDELELYIKDDINDTGIEPNPTIANMWESKDIWIRNTNDGRTEHQNPVYKSNNEPNYIYVRIKNKSCVTSSGNETLTVNWAKASTALNWPNDWNGAYSNSYGNPMSGELVTVQLPIIKFGSEKIIKIPWVVPNPLDYSTDLNSDPWHFCLLARINATDDPNTYPMTSNPNIMVRNNNNMAWKNVTVLLFNDIDDIDNNITKASVMVANPTNTNNTYLLELIKDNNENGKAIYEEAEISVKMDDVLFNAWEHGGKIAQELEEKNDEKEKLVKGNNVLIDNIALNANEKGLLTLDFKFLTKEVTDKEEFVYRVIQKDATTGEIVGGETFIIRKKPRVLFVANAGNDKEVDLNETVTITAESVSGIAEYNWYDSEGNFVYQGKDLNVSADIAKKYKLEVVTQDGFKDYDEVEVKLRPGYIEAISPNPSSNTINIDYRLNGAISAYLMIVGVSDNSSYNYILDSSDNSILIDISNFTNGNFSIILVCDGQVTDAKQLIKQ